MADAVRVTRVRPLSRDPSVRVVDVEGLGSLRVDADSVRRWGLVAGGVLDAAGVQRLRAAAERHEARATALRLLARRLRSRRELAHALRRRGVSRLTQLAVLEELERAGWIDDSRFARAWVRDRLALRPAGVRRLRAELAARGVDRAVIAAALAELLPAADEEEVALGQAKARLRRLRGLPPPVVRRRVAAWLARRGFRSEVIAAVLRTVLTAPPDAPDVDPAA